MTSRVTFPMVVLLAALALAVGAMLRVTACSDKPQRAQRAAPPAAALVDPDAAPGEGETELPEAEPLRTLAVEIYYPAAGRDGLVGEQHEIFMTPTPGDRAKQILAELIEGPSSDRALRAVPPGTRLRQVYVLEGGTAYLDFTHDLKTGLPGGSMEELLTVYAIIDSVALNVSEIRRIGILIDGDPVETLNGHIDLRRPLPPDRSLIGGRRS